MKRNYAMISIAVTKADPATNVVEFTSKGDPALHVIDWVTSEDVAQYDAAKKSADPFPPPLPKGGAKLDVLLSDDYVGAEIKAGRNITVGPTGFKYPERLADAAVAYTNVPFRITNLVVSGVELVTGEHFSATLDLTDPRMAALAQSITYDARSQDVNLALSRAALEELGISR